MRALMEVVAVSFWCSNGVSLESYVVECGVWSSTIVVVGSRVESMSRVLFCDDHHHHHRHSRDYYY
jgi:hypothetical protein